MLILPLHKKPTLANFPWVTLLLVLVNVFIYVALQAPDNDRHASAVESYANSRLAQIELPAYRDYVERTPSISWRERWRQMPEPMRTRVLAMQVQGEGYAMLLDSSGSMDTAYATGTANTDHLDDGKGHR